MTKQAQIFNAYMMGLYESAMAFRDDLEAVSRPFEQTARYKRVCLYPYLKNRVNYLGDFYLDYLMTKKEDKEAIERAKREAQAQQLKQEKIEKYENMNKEFSKFFERRIY